MNTKKILNRDSKCGVCHKCADVIRKNNLLLSYGNSVRVCDKCLSKIREGVDSWDREFFKKYIDMMEKMLPHYIDHEIDQFTLQEQIDFAKVKFIRKFGGGN